MDIAERMQAPPDFVAASAIVALGSVIGRQVGIRPQAQTDWTVIPNLWAVIIGRPGIMKSPAMGEALKPLKRLETQARGDYETAYSAFSAADRECQLRVKAATEKTKADLKKSPGADISAIHVGDKPEEPSVKRFIA